MTDSADEVVEYAEQRIYDITNARVNTGFYSLREGCRRVSTAIIKWRARAESSFSALRPIFADLTTCWAVCITAT